jgi:hypothetical protein
MDIRRSEQVESELDAMIERRARQKDPDEENEHVEQLKSQGICEDLAVDEVMKMMQRKETS